MTKNNMTKLLILSCSLILFFRYLSFECGRYLPDGGGTAFADAGQTAAPKKAAETEKKTKDTTTRLFVYKPPMRGRPGNRVGGSSRGLDRDMPFIAALVPDHTGLTTSAQPTLYWYLSKPTTYKVQFTLIDDKGIEPIIEEYLKDVGEGIHSIKLSDYRQTLLLGIEYQWFVSIVRDRDQRSKDILATGMIRRTEAPEIVADAMKAGRTGAYYVYAEHGIWYDALSAISELIEENPHDKFLESQRASLLKQVGLPEIVGGSQ